MTLGTDAEEKCDQHLTIWVTRSLRERIEARCGELAYKPTVSKWVGLVVSQCLDELKKTKDRRARD